MTRYTQIKMEGDIIALRFCPLNLPREQADIFVAALCPNLLIVAVVPSSHGRSPKFVHDTPEMRDMVRCPLLLNP